MGKWIGARPNIRYREHPTRKLGKGNRPDRYFTVRVTIDGRRAEEPLGWASEGWTLDRAQEVLGQLRLAQRTGEGAVTLRERRQEAKAARQRAANEPTMADLWRRYAIEVVAVANRPSTARQKQRMWLTRIEPAMGRLKITEVTAEDVGAAVRGRLRLDGGGQVVAGKAEAGNLHRLLRSMFNKALIWGLRPRGLGNPLAGVAGPKVARRERLLTGSEIGALQWALDEGTEEPSVIAIIRTAILTGCRIGELLGLQHEDIRRDAPALHLRDTKTGFSRRPISAAAISAIDTVERRPGVPHVFYTTNGPVRPLTYGMVEKAFHRIVEAAGVRDCTLHTVRHWFTTMTANSVSNPRVGMMLTGHKSVQAYLAYVHGDQEQARALAEQLAVLATGTGAASPNVAVLPLPKKQRR